MEYTILKLATLAGISNRTLRYYDEIGLLKPAKINSSGYRIYGKNEVDLLQQILFFKELDMDLDTIKAIITSPKYDAVTSLKAHHKRLLDKQQHIDRLLHNVERSIDTLEGRTLMTDQEKFEGFKQDLLDTNELNYGQEIRETYGDEVVNESYKKMKKLSKQEYEQLEQLSLDVNAALKKAFELGDPSSSLAMDACELHKKWICAYWPTYSKEAHLSLVQMYVDDLRFTAYYDKIVPGCAVFLRDAMTVYLA